MTQHDFSLPVFFAVIAAMVAIAGLSVWMSRINRFFFFARTLPSSFTDTARAKTIVQQYVGMALISAGLSIVLFVLLYAVNGRPSYYSLVISVLLQAVLANLAFARAHHAAGAAYAEFKRDAASVESSVRSQVEVDRGVAVSLLPSKAPATLQAMLAPPLLAISVWLGGIATSSYSISSFSDAAGQQGGSVLLGFACGMLFAGTAMRLMMRYSARHRTPMAHYLGKVMVALSWFSAAIIGGIVIATRMHHVIAKTSARAVMIGVLCLLFAHFVYVWSRSNDFTPSSAEFNGDQNWLGGLFYYNRQDPALFVQRRSGPGYTLNFGNVFSWPITAFVVADFAFLILSRHHG